MFNRREKRSVVVIISTSFLLLAMSISTASATLVTVGPTEDFRAEVSHIVGEFEITETEGEINLLIFKFKWKDRGKIRINKIVGGGSVSEDVVGVGYVSYDNATSVADLLSPTSGETLTLTTIFGLDTVTGPLTSVGGLNFASPEFSLLENEIFEGLSTSKYTATSTLLTKAAMLNLPELALASSEQLSLFNSASSGDRFWVSQATLPAFDFVVVPIPEPATICLFGLGGLALRRRRRAC